MSLHCKSAQRLFPYIICDNNPLYHEMDYLLLICIDSVGIADLCELTNERLIRWCPHELLLHSQSRYHYPTTSKKGISVYISLTLLYSDMFVMHRK